MYSQTENCYNNLNNIKGRYCNNWASEMNKAGLGWVALQKLNMVNYFLLQYLCYKGNIDHAILSTTDEKLLGVYT